MQHAELGLTGPELHLVIAEADDNADGTIDVRNARDVSFAPRDISDLAVRILKHQRGVSVCLRVILLPPNFINRLALARAS